MPANSNNVHQPPSITTAHPTATMYHHPAKHSSEGMPNFFGKQNEKLVTYIKKMEEYAKLFALNNTDFLRCMRMSLQSTAYSITEGQNHSFLLQFWSAKIQSNIHSRLTYEHWDPKKEKTIEERLSEVYVRTRHLTAAMNDEEFVDVVIPQLPITYERQFTGGVYRDLIRVDQLERQARK
ncbi:hypothetical protein PR048_033011 [Dryococelus australis]|uniref:Gag protein n=1 Tax=Dryococelus australis TaxID=614101 RepID=A0ABQ9G6S6_9NEOP|nr:hypothetical protein PR048_033011 [Dryococelus australis]